MEDILITIEEVEEVLYNNDISYRSSIDENNEYEITITLGTSFCTSLKPSTRAPSRVIDTHYILSGDELEFSFVIDNNYEFIEPILVKSPLDILKVVRLLNT